MPKEMFMKKKKPQKIALMGFLARKNEILCPGSGRLLPARLSHSGNQTSICKFTQTESGNLELFIHTAWASCKPAAASEPDRGAVSWHFIKCNSCILALFFRKIWVDRSLFEILSLVPVSLYHLFAPFLAGNNRFFCHSTSFLLLRYFMRAGPFWRCFLVGSFLLITYTRPFLLTRTSPLEVSAFTDARTLMCTC